ncbi:hypothetical protein Y695_00509 [Hydrogenophaga sp. T4]|jgi:hypothetical protein|uniref:hypothetical protein n=1 Tax=Hydrogenophaga sp. TaxID=1904254 RepID=UPI0003F4214F|nr:hypothetical protein [Hydrogenophaga sp.]EWS66212.1 hypothetical protein Y695_00509 [Hydrogenophaga sp. T4]MDO9481049.1 hypothetical protein [Hydrogenophaga sp.]MDP3805029.1 hypothetical protein [Hydrogenophaga sp.]MDP3923362.1 hypothetical protein [Hydrogenophaga sp.]
MTAHAVNGKLTGYQVLIQEATGVTELDHIERIEDTMRNVIFHSTLDWQTREQLEQGAREALQIITLV